MNVRLTFVAAVAVLLTSLSLNAVLSGNGWFIASIGAVATVALAGILSRATGMRSAAATTFLVLVAVIPLLVGATWLARAAGIVLVLLVAASATGARLLRGFAVMATYLAGLLIYLCVVFANAACYARIIPSPRALTSLGHSYTRALAEFRYSPPVPDIWAVSFVTAAGIGLVAITVDLLAARMRRPALAGLPLLLLFSVPVATNLKQIAIGQSITFALSLAGYLALLSADGRDRLRMWGRLVTFRHVQTADETGTGPDTRELSASGRRIGLAALCLAVIVPALIPPGRVHDLFGTTTTGGGSGSANVDLQPLLQVQQQLEGKAEPVLTYTTNDRAAADQYLQVYVLNYDASKNNWLPTFPTSGDRSMGGTQLPWQPPGVTSRTPVTVTKTAIRMNKDQSGQPVLPLPYAPEKLTVPGSPWLETRNSLMVFSTKPGALADLQYTVTSKEPQPTGAQIDKPGVIPVAIDPYGSYNGPDAQKLMVIAQEHTAGAITNLQLALDLQNWFRSGAFTYSLKNVPVSSNWLLKFLTTDKRGVCRQFAWAFAVLARLVGIPSRIAVGYTAGTYSVHTGSWQVTTADAHAWPELYFAGYGWLRFEPTPTTHGQGTATLPSYATSAGSTGSTTQSGRPGQQQTNPGNLKGHSGKAGGSQLLCVRSPNAPGCHVARTSPGSAAHSAGASLAIVIAVLSLVFVLLAWPSVTRLLTRRRRWLTASGDAGLAEAAWRELVDDMADLGLPCSPSETPRTTARRIARAGNLDQNAAQAVTRLSAAEERARYAQSPQPGAGLAGDVRTVRRAVAASVSRSQRVRAGLLPASTLAAASKVLQRGGEMLSWLESSWPRMRRQLRAALHRAG